MPFSKQSYSFSSDSTEEGEHDKYYNNFCMEDNDSSSDYSIGTSLTTTNYEESNKTSSDALWRLDPFESFSDWTIEIQTGNGNSKIVETYHVHRVILAFGPRKSRYFANLFQCSNENMNDIISSCANEEASLLNRTTRLDFTDRAAATFPSFLDYIYSCSHFEITTRNAIALGFLAQCLMVTPLQEEIERFVKTDLQVSNMGLYLSDAIHFQDQLLSTQILDMCAEEIARYCINTKNMEASILSDAITLAKQTNNYEPLWQCLGQFPLVMVAKVRSDASKRNSSLDGRQKIYYPFHFRGCRDKPNNKKT